MVIERVTVLTWAKYVWVAGRSVADSDLRGSPHPLSFLWLQFFFSTISNLCVQELS